MCVCDARMALLISLTHSLHYRHNALDEHTECTGGDGDDDVNTTTECSKKKVVIIGWPKHQQQGDKSRADQCRGT